MNKDYKFVIELNEYAGNVERELCAYITGMIGACEVGEEFVQLYKKETNDTDLSIFSEYVEQKADDHGTYRPVSIGGGDGTTVEIYFGKKPTKKQINIMKERANKFFQLKEFIEYKILGFKLVTSVTTQTIEIV